ncbi:hypothetical protein BC629DRAFT_643655 [Irpex lacteus]|nr:hypothetical protein BC629DRAFT_643655 [Irpex lacteus]
MYKLSTLKMIFGTYGPFITSNLIKTHTRSFTTLVSFLTSSLPPRPTGARRLPRSFARLPLLLLDFYFSLAPAWIPHSFVIITIPPTLRTSALSRCTHTTLSGSLHRLSRSRWPHIFKVENHHIIHPPHPISGLPSFATVDCRIHLRIRRLLRLHTRSRALHLLARLSWTFSLAVAPALYTSPYLLPPRCANSPFFVLRLAVE